MLFLPRTYPNTPLPDPHPNYRPRPSITYDTIPFPFTSIPRNSSPDPETEITKVRKLSETCFSDLKTTRGTSPKLLSKSMPPMEVLKTAASPSTSLPALDVSPAHGPTTETSSPSAVELEIQPKPIDEPKSPSTPSPSTKPSCQTPQTPPPIPKIPKIGKPQHIKLKLFMFLYILISLFIIGFLCFRVKYLEEEAAGREVVWRDLIKGLVGKRREEMRFDNEGVFDDDDDDDEGIEGREEVSKMEASVGWGWKGWERLWGSGGGRDEKGSEGGG